MQVKQRLDALTSFRFIAAVMIVITHAEDPFGFNTTPPFFNLEQGVSFFFILSGFILAYVYPKFDSWPDIWHFWRARVARVWPALAASFILAFCLLSLEWDHKTALANLLMINAWIPFQNYFCSYNCVSWSISTEFFFYLAFPLIIYKWKDSWLIKLLASGVVVILLIILTNAYFLTDYDPLKDNITPGAILYIHPLSRIFEFILGICVATYWKYKIGLVQWSNARASLYEIGVILLVFACMHYTDPLEKWAYNSWLGPATSQWLVGSGSMFAFALLIYVVAIGNGRVTAWLSHPMPVLLGEISYSLYLLHQILLRYYQANQTSFPPMPKMMSYAIFWVILLLSSYLMWAFIEMPGRRLMLGRGKNTMHGTQIMKESWRTHLNINRKTMATAIILSLVLAYIYPSK
jgi:peptidoglycan/LPS O-acetylase OafA/YrhL